MDIKRIREIRECMECISEINTYIDILDNEDKNPRFCAKMQIIKERILTHVGKIK